ncbi:MAG TPA: PEGA domain-containing protein [Candidatus Polarisedimenticolia bacterium]|nr:PEGA domain-containing protein [Candidatus Polarisedimenticolia bacterium]
MQELLATQKLEKVQTPVPLPLRIASVVVSEEAGKNGDVDDRWDSRDAFRGTYADEFRQGLAYYLKERGFKVVSSKGAISARIYIDRFKGFKRSGQYGGDLRGTMVLRLNGKEIGSNQLFENISYEDDSEEQAAFAKEFYLEKVSFPTVLFYNLTVSLYDSIAQGIQEAASDAGLEIPPPVQGRAPMLREGIPAAVPAVAPPPPPVHEAAPPVALKTVPPPRPPREMPKTGILTIESTPDDAEIYLDSRLLATTPARRLHLSAGDHSIMVKKAGYVDWVREFTVLEDTDLTLKATLEPNSPPQEQPEEEILKQ